MASKKPNPSLTNTIYLLLIQCATEHRSMSYSELAEQVGLPSAGCHMSNVLSKELAKLLQYCRQRGLPLLPALVVKASGTFKGVPGNGFWIELGLGDFTAAQRKEWTRIYHNQVFAIFGGPQEMMSC